MCWQRCERGLESGSAPVACRATRPAKESLQFPRRRAYTSPAMNRHLFRKWALWLLPLLVARAFLPVGFMVWANADGLALVFCAGQAPVFTQAHEPQAAVDHAARGIDHSQHHAQSAADEHVARHGQLDQPCPFALAAVAIAAEVPYLHTESQRLTDESLDTAAQLPASAGPVRADRIRGPPSLS